MTWHSLVINCLVLLVWITSGAKIQHLSEEEQYRIFHDGLSMPSVLEKIQGSEAQYNRYLSALINFDASLHGPEVFRKALLQSAIKQYIIDTEKGKILSLSKGAILPICTHHNLHVEVERDWDIYWEAKEEPYAPKLFEGKPLVSVPSPTAAFTVIYCEGTDQRENLNKLAEKFLMMHHVSPDGNCLYRSFATGLLSYHNTSGWDGKVKHSNLFESASKNMPEHCIRAASLLSGLIKNRVLFKLEFILEILNSPKVSDAIVFLLRHMVGDYESINSSFIMGTEVEDTVYPMGAWGGETELSNFARLFELRIGCADLYYCKRLVYGAAGGDADKLDIEVLFKGGHYDVFCI
jgi:hypothetical protein